MKDCKVTQYKKSVENDTLPLFDAIKVNWYVRENQNFVAQGIAFSDIVVTDGAVEFVSNQTPYQGYFHSETVAENAKVLIKDKYNLTRLELQGAQLVNGFDDIAYLKKLTSLSLGYRLSSPETFYNANIADISLLAQLPLLTNIVIVDSNMTGDVASLVSTFGNTLTRLFITGVNVKQKMSDLGKFKALTTLNGSIRTNMNGAIEDFVASGVALGVTSKTITASYLGGNGLITFNDAAISSVSSNSISWAPNASVPTNTDVTYNGTTTTITVAPNGTWTRVS